MEKTLKKGIRNREANLEDDPQPRTIIITDLEEQENPGLTWGNGDVSNYNDDDDTSSVEVSQ